MNRIAAVVVGLSPAFVGTAESLATVFTVCHDCYYSSIQQAIDAASDGDTISIAAGTYYEGDFNTNGKAVTITRDSDELGEILIDAEGYDRVFTFNNGEGSDTLLIGLTIIGGWASSGGGISCENSSPTIKECTIKDNTASNWGGGIYCYYSNATIIDCTIEDNTAEAFDGGGIYCLYSNPIISGCSILGNTAGNRGGGIVCYDSSPTITDCTISGNTASVAFAGGGISCDSDSSPVHGNCTFSSNTPDNVNGDTDWNPFRDEGGPSIITLEDCTLCGTGEHVVGIIKYLGHNHISDCTDEGDLDGDGDVDTDDLALMHTATETCHHDVNHNGITDIDDLLYVIEGWNDTCTP